MAPSPFPTHPQPPVVRLQHPLESCLEEQLSCRGFAVLQPSGGVGGEGALANTFLSQQHLSRSTLGMPCKEFQVRSFA